VSVQLEALADEVFDAAAAQGRIGSQSRRLSCGEAIWNPDYPDLFFLNGIGSLAAPDWAVDDIESLLHEILPSVRTYRAYSRDPKTVASLGPSFLAAGYQHEVRLAMVQAFVHPSPFPLPGESRSERFVIAPVDDSLSWAAFDDSVRTDGSEHGWNRSMIEQMIRLHHWRATNSPTRFYVAYHGERPVGHVGLFQHGPTAYLHGLYTRPDARRQGVGGGLTLAMGPQSKAMGCDRLTLQCSDDGYLPGYYTRLGFRPVGEQHIWTKFL
jgi:GNAT superfamily N-acetyltransferase